MEGTAELPLEKMGGQSWSSRDVRRKAGGTKGRKAAIKVVNRRKKDESSGEDQRQLRSRELAELKDGLATKNAPATERCDDFNANEILRSPRRGGRYLSKSQI